MKKIQVTTIEKTANVQIIELNASFITKAISAKINAEITSEELMVRAEEGKFTKQTLISADSARRIVYEVLPFLLELTNALEGNDEE